MKVMKLLLLCCLSMILIWSACTNHSDIEKAGSTFYIVQPAEHFQGFNGHLNWYGRERAGDLMRFLKDSSVARIYLNSFSRSLETADSLRHLKNIDTINYPMDSMVDKLFNRIKAGKDFGKKILIVSLPEDINPIIRKLGGTIQSDTLHKNQFNQLYILRNNKGKAVLNKKKFGKKNMPISDSGLADSSVSMP